MNNEMKFELKGTIKKVTKKVYPSGKVYVKVSISFIDNEMEYIFQVFIDESIQNKVCETDKDKLITVRGFVHNYLSKSGYVNQTYLAKDVTIEENKEKINW